MQTKSKSGSGGIALPDQLAYLYTPILPYIKNIQINRQGKRHPKPADILLPEGYVAEVVAIGFNAPSHCTFDNAGYCYVAETGHKVDALPRIAKVNVQTGSWESYYELPAERWHETGAITGICWHDGLLYVMNTDTLSRIHPDGRLEDIVTGLPGLGDHQANYPVVGPDGKIYFGQGCVTNNGVVGPDNAAFEWLAKHPDVCDVPAEDVTLVGHNFASRNILGSLGETVYTGAYVPFGRETYPGQVIPGNVKCSGSILRCNLDGSELEVVAWGLRNPYGVAFDAKGRLYASEHGSDERGARFIFDDPDDFYEITPGGWYGWPDFASGIRLDDPHWGEGGRHREPVLAHHPNPHPPKPVASFFTHVAANGFDFCLDQNFGFFGDAFVACFGDLAPITTVKRALTPAGFSVMRVDMKTRQVVPFAVNKIAGPASKLPHEGFERPSHCQFGPDGNLYVVDYGIINIALEQGAIRMQKGTGMLWRIRPTGAPKGNYPPEPMTLPTHGLQYLVVALGAVGIVVLAGVLLKRLLART